MILSFKYFIRLFTLLIHLLFYKRTHTIAQNSKYQSILYSSPFHDAPFMNELNMHEVSEPKRGV